MKYTKVWDLVFYENKRNFAIFRKMGRDKDHQIKKKIKARLKTANITYMLSF